MKKYISGALKLVASGLLLYTVYEQNKVIQKYKHESVSMINDKGDTVNMEINANNTQNVIDSLEGEIFNANTAVGRYELSLQHLEEINPKAAKQFNDYLTHETE
jgi:hypothetical protein